MDPPETQYFVAETLAKVWDKAKELAMQVATDLMKGSESNGQRCHSSNTTIELNTDGSIKSIEFKSGTHKCR